MSTQFSPVNIKTEETNTRALVDKTSKIIQLYRETVKYILVLLVFVKTNFAGIATNIHRENNEEAGEENYEIL